ncbi:MAG: hypothetical protein FWD69_20085 [Polyangiaceae bacterium]|nr:hypothetical protein [Polyangiaceae bacterium]
MIVWPAETQLNEDGREGLRRFRQTGACAEFRQSPERWRVVAWPWTAEMPLRFELESDRRDAIDVFIDEDGLWRTESAARELHERGAAALQQDAAARV